MTHPTTTVRSARASYAPMGGSPSLRPLVLFAAAALPAGWLLLTLYQVLGLPQEPFVLGTLVLGLVAPAVVLTAHEGGRPAVAALLRQAGRVSRPLWWLPAAVLVLPTVTWSAAFLVGGARPATASLVVDYAVAVLAGALVVNIWEELAWTGFVQRRAMARWGTELGALVTAGLFVAIHLPLAFDGADDVSDVMTGLTALVATGIGLRLLIGHLDGWSGRSLLTIGLLHASFNATSALVEPDKDWIRLAVTVLFGATAVVASAVGRRSHRSATFTRR